MKMQLKTIGAALISCVALASCDNDASTSDPIIDVFPETLAYVLNEGTMGYNIEGSLTVINYGNGMTSNGAFKQINGRTLGDTPQCGIVYGDKIYLGVYMSNTIEVVDRFTLKSVKQISLANETGQNPRSMAVDNGKVYISMYNGYVARLDTASLAIDKTVQVGANPEKIAVLNGKLYVPNSDGMNYPNYGATASCIDLESFTVEKTFDVVLNPYEFFTNGEELFLVSRGDYGAVPGTLCQINPATFESTRIADATLATVNRDIVYFINAPYGQSATYSTYTIPTKTIAPMPGNMRVDYPVAISAKPDTDPNFNIIVITSMNSENDYSAEGYCKIFNGPTPVGTFNTGVNPTGVFF